MRKNLVSILGALLVFALGTVALADAVTLQTATRYEFTNCASGGSASQTLAPGPYLLRVFDEDVWLCYSATCATGGERFAPGSIVHLNVPTPNTQAASCRSTSSTGDLVFTQAN